MIWSEIQCGIMCYVIWYGTMWRVVQCGEMCCVVCFNVIWFEVRYNVVECVMLFGTVWCVVCFDVVKHDVALCHLVRFGVVKCRKEFLNVRKANPKIERWRILWNANAMKTSNKHPRQNIQRNLKLMAATKKHF